MERITQTDRLIRQKKLPGGKITKLGEGSFGEVFKVDAATPYVVKWQKKRDMAHAEAVGLAEMAKMQAAEVPGVLAVYEGAPGEEDCIVMTYLQGIPMSQAKLKRKERKIAAKAVAEAVSKFITKDGTFGVVGEEEFSTWQEFYKGKVASLLQKAEKLCDKKQLSARVFLLMQTAFSKFDTIFGDLTVTRAFVHGDLNPENIMLNADGTLSGFYDPIGSLYGDSEYELFELESNGGNRYRILQEYAKIFPLSQEYPVKRDFYRLFAEVGYYYDADMREGRTLRKWAAALRKSLKKFIRLRGTAK